MADRPVRDIGFLKGPRFYREDGVVMFIFGIDPSNVLGPRPATKVDQADHAGAWQEFLEKQHKPQLDRDGDGLPGGSLPDPETIRRRGGRPRKNV